MLSFNAVVYMHRRFIASSKLRIQKLTPSIPYVTNIATRNRRIASKSDGIGITTPMNPNFVDRKFSIPAISSAIHPLRHTGSKLKPPRFITNRFASSVFLRWVGGNAQKWGNLSITLVPLHPGMQRIFPRTSMKFVFLPTGRKIDMSWDKKDVGARYVV